ARAWWACRSQSASLLACQTPLRLGLPSAVRAGRDAWPAVRVTDTVMTALTAAAPIATPMSDPANRFRIEDISFFLFPSSFSLLPFPFFLSFPLTHLRPTHQRRLRCRNLWRCPWWPDRGLALR